MNRDFFAFTPSFFHQLLWNMDEVFYVAAPAALNPQSGTLMFLVLVTWVSRGGRDFGGGGPMGVQETSVLEVIVDWRLEVSFLD
ncbi:hypothetical protein TNCV_130881 [Trichonephila clavipes]|nr:hypothetical protein TNCV_130881 [Trichonephila clavipes]